MDNTLPNAMPIPTPRSLRLIRSVAALTLFVAGVAQGQELRHRFLCIDNFAISNANRLILVDQFRSTNSWVVAIPAGSRDIQLLDDGKRALISHGSGAAEYDMATGRCLAWHVECFRDIQSAVRRPNGETWLGGLDGTLYRLDAQGREIGHVKPATNLNVRLLRPIDDEHVLVSGAAPRALFEMTLDGGIARKVPMFGKSKGYLAVRLPNGNYRTSGGDECQIAEITGAGAVVWSVGGKDRHPSLGLDFCSGWDVLPNGNYVMANWLGHGKHGTGVHLAEFTPDNLCVWTWTDHQLANQITNVKVLR